MKLSIVVVFCLPLLTTGAGADEPETWRTIPGELTGYYWRTLNFGEKLAFVEGFMEGHSSARPSNDPAIKAKERDCLSAIDNPDNQQKHECRTKSLDAKSEEYKRWDKLDPLPPGTFGDTVRATDRFFEDVENRYMPIAAAWSITKAKQEGEPQQYIDSLMDSYRERYIRAVRDLCALGALLEQSLCSSLGYPFKTTPLP